MATPSHSDLQTLFVEIEELHPQPTETTRAYAAFKDYCALGPGRSMRALCDAYRERKNAIKASTDERRKSGIPAESGADLPMIPPTSQERTLEEWSSINKWQERVRIYESNLGKVARALEVKAIAEMNDRHTNFALAMLNLAAGRMQLMQGDELSVSELRLFITEAIRIERMTRGVDSFDLSSAEIEAGARTRKGRFQIVEVVKDYGAALTAGDE